MSAPVPSRGHLCFAGGWEWVVGVDGCLWRVPEGNPLEANGWRSGARWECEPRDRETFLKHVKLMTT